MLTPVVVHVHILTIRPEYCGPLRQEAPVARVARSARVAFCATLPLHVSRPVYSLRVRTRRVPPTHSPLASHSSRLKPLQTLCRRARLNLQLLAVRASESLWTRFPRLTYSRTLRSGILLCALYASHLRALCASHLRARDLAVYTLALPIPCRSVSTFGTRSTHPTDEPTYTPARVFTRIYTSHS